MIGVVMWGTLVSSAAEVPDDLGEALLFFSDTDQSGMLDTALEIRGLTCEHWTTLDEIARATYGQPFWLVAGLEVGFPIGGGLPIDVNLWGEAATQLHASTTRNGGCSKSGHAPPYWYVVFLSLGFPTKTNLRFKTRDVRRIRCDTWQAIGGL